MKARSSNMAGISTDWTSAADLKFLQPLRQTQFRNFKSKSGTRIICLLVPLLLPKFVSEGAAMYHELRKRGTSVPIPKFAIPCGTFSCELRNQRDTSKSMILVPLLNPKFAIELPARLCELRVRGTRRARW